MDLSQSAEGRRLLGVADVFFHCYLLPHNPAWHQSVAQGVYPPPFLEDLKALARDEGLWNLFLPRLLPHEPGTRLSNLDYAPIAEILGRLPWASEVFNCSAPDTGNMELLHRFGSDAQKTRWLRPLLKGSIRSAFAMSEPDVASSDPTNLQTEVAVDGDTLVLNGRKWFITGAAHPQCQLLIVMCRHSDQGAAPAVAGKQPDTVHHRHSMVLVPLDTPGVEVVRNIPVLNHQAPEGHCEILLRGVRVPSDHVLGPWGEGVAMAQARLGPGRVHHCMRAIGQCELALQLACERVLERAIQIFGAMGLSPDTPLADFFSWGRAMHLMDGPDEVHLRTVARQELRLTRTRAGQGADYFTTPEQRAAPPRIH